MYSEEVYARVVGRLDYDRSSGVLSWRDGRRGGKVAGTVKDGYVMIKFGGCNLFAHRVVWYMEHGELPELVDHISGVGTDNRLENLRAGDRAGNSRNRRIGSNNKSGVPGVYWVAREGMWRVEIIIKRKRKNLGRHAEFSDAVAARKAGELKYHGEFAAHLGVLKGGAGYGA